MFKCHTPSSGKAESTIGRTSLASDRGRFIGGSDARVIMGSDEAALLRVWREKRGEAELENFSDNLTVQLGVVTDDLNRRWYERNTGQVIPSVQRHVQHRVIRFSAATLDGIVEGTGAVFESKFMLWSFSEEAAAGSNLPSRLIRSTSISCSRSKEILALRPMGEPPRLFLAETAKVRIEAVRIVDMSSSNSWAESTRAHSRDGGRKLEDADDYKAFEARVISDFKPRNGDFGWPHRFVAASAGQFDRDHSTRYPSGDDPHPRHSTGDANGPG